MTLRTRIAVIAAVAVAIAVLAASTGIYLATARTLRDSVDRSLVDLAREFRSPRPGPRVSGPRPPGRFGGAGGFIQYVSSRGQVLGSLDVEPLPVGEQVTDVAAGERDAFFETVRVDGEPVRVLTFPVERGVAAQVARPLDEVQATLRTLRRRLAIGSLGGIALAAILGTVVARRATRPVGELTRLAEEVATTQDLSQRIAVARDDEIGRLAATVNTMLANLEQARHAQEQLVADASHELRTPLTSLRTNVEVLAEAERLDPEDRRRVIGDVVEQLDEFARMVGDLVELARGDRPVQAAVPVRLDQVAAEVVRRATTDDRIHLRAVPATVVGDRDRLERAIRNLLDNAMKYGGDGPLEVAVEQRDREAVLRVADRGPGIAPQHLDRIFDRFYRAPEARGAPGSGLGLSIVAQIAASHGGRVEAANREDERGAVFTLTLPTEDVR